MEGTAAPVTPRGQPSGHRQRPGAQEAALKSAVPAAPRLLPGAEPCSGSPACQGRESCQGSCINNMATLCTEPVLSPGAWRMRHRVLAPPWHEPLAAPALSLHTSLRLADQE